jgi:endonuclease-3 related protein
MYSHYGSRGWWPLVGKGYHPGRSYVPAAPGECFEIMVGAVLTQNTSWNNVGISLRILHDRLLLEPEALLKVSEEELARLIRSSGYFRQKSRKLRIAASYFLEKGFHKTGPASVPEREELLSLWGIGAETADSVLLYAFGVPAVVIDAYTRRILERLGLAPGGDSAIRTFLAESTDGLEKSEAAVRLNEFHALFVEHGKRYCKKRNPFCGECCMAAYCPGASVQL